MHWTQTITGQKIDLLNPTADMIRFTDVAHNLAHCNRFAGATRRPYSVAEHCVRVHDELRRNKHDKLTQIVGLLHDAHEAFMGDITTPTKNALMALADVHPIHVRDAINALKLRLDVAIFAAAGLDREDATVDAALRGPVHGIDAKMMMAERDVLMAKSPEPWPGLEDLPRPPLTRHAGWRPATAQHLWLSRLESHLTDMELAA